MSNETANERSQHHAVVLSTCGMCRGDKAIEAPDFSIWQFWRWGKYKLVECTYCQGKGKVTLVIPPPPPKTFEQKMREREVAALEKLAGVSVAGVNR